MAGFQAKLNDWIVPAALGAMLYFMQSIAHDSQDMAKNLAVALRRLDEYERRITALEERPVPARRGPH